ncbi:c-type cytochrome biogenesis protein CcmI [Ascidiaceihabitans sp.]|uniref:c-type cytochrome biogenesis protein CcmI n=1 Tax=Ascidiaceihabitans sp. TaxID=1872644 RepID=UPI0032982EAC
MLFWIITGGLTLSVVALLSLAFLRARVPGADAATFDVQVYRDQLAEVDRDLARGVLSEADATRVRTEVSRRILTADATKANASVSTAGGAPFVASVLVALAVTGGAFGLYIQIGAPGYGDLALKDRIEMAESLRADRPAQQEAEDSLGSTPALQNAAPDYVALVEKLRLTVAQRPDDLQGNVLLARSEANLGNYAAAHRAQETVLRLKGSSATIDDITDYADMMILAAGGYVSPEAERVLQVALTQDAGNGTARYYWGLMNAQTGRPDVAFRIWDQQLRAGPPDAPWIAPILQQIEDMAARSGVNYQIPTVGDGVTRGPSADDIEAAGDMTGAERMEMIEGMVEGLSERLASEGGTPQEWAQLIGALGVLGRTQQARAVYDNGVEVFKEDPAALDLLNRAGERVNVAE